MRFLALIFFVSLSAQAGTWSEINQSLIQKDWALADLLLEERSRKKIRKIRIDNAIEI